jgi:hypothetical protein
MGKAREDAVALGPRNSCKANARPDSALVLIGRQRHESTAAAAEMRGNSKWQPQVAEVLVGLNTEPVQHNLHVLLNEQQLARQLLAGKKKV